MDNGVRYAYTGNVRDVEGGSTRCHQCKALLIERIGYTIGECNLSADGRCERCGTAMAGVIDGPVGDWGPRRQPVRIASRAAAPGTA
jgi:pyruvate formate lyase activating enzyme